MEERFGGRKWRISSGRNLLLCFGFACAYTEVSAAQFRAAESTQGKLAMSTQSKTTKAQEATESTTNKETETMNEQVTDESIAAYTTDMPAYVEAKAALGGSIHTTVPTAAALGAVMATLAEGGSPLPYLIAGHGIAPAGSQVDSVADQLPEPGANGYVLAIVGARGLTGADGKPRNAGTSIAIYPAYSVDEVLAHDAGRAYIERVVSKELGHVAFRSVRLNVTTATLNALDTGAQEMPVALSDFVVRTSQGGGASGQFFASNWGAFIQLLKDKKKLTPAKAKRLPVIAEVKKCLRSEAYAADNYAAQEADGLFMTLGRAFVSIMGAKQDALNEAGANADEKGKALIPGDRAEVTRWLDARDTFTFEATPVGEAVGLELDDLADLMG